MRIYIAYCDVPADIADTEQTLQAVVAATVAAVVAAAAAALSSVAPPVAFVQLVVLVEPVWSCQWISAGASVGPWRDRST